MTMQQIKELYETRQSCREFSSRPVERALIEEVCSLARLAPSACNLQPWKLYALTGGKKAEATKYLQRLGMNKFLDQAPLLLVVAKKEPESAEQRGAEFVSNDAGIFTAHLVLAAEAAGLNTCIIGWREEKKLAAFLSLPEGWSIPLVVALGYAAEGYPTRPKTRKPLDEILTFVD